jgi:hypothetical protein
LARSDANGWTLPTLTSTGEGEWLAVQNASNCLNGCIVQDGYTKFLPGTADGCTTGTGGDVKQTYYGIIPNTGSKDTFICTLGQVIGSGEGHSEALRRCGGSDWCYFTDGSQVGGAVANSGIGATAPQAVTFGEFLCHACQEGSPPTTMRAEYGTNGSIGTAWSVSANSDGTGYVDLKNADAPGGASDYCIPSSAATWQNDPVSYASLWEIYWVANGDDCS